MSNQMIKLENINKSYENRVVLDDLNLDIYDGDFISIVGQSGAGKSTLLNIIALFEKCDSGTISFHGKKISLNMKNLNEFRNQHIGFIFQNFNLIENLSVRDNILLPLEYSSSEIKKNWFNNYDYLMNELGIINLQNTIVKALSGGEKQRVAIARALITNPDVIIADEPTGSLDEKSRNEVLDVLLSLNQKGVTIVIVTHDNYVANFAKRILHLENCKLIEK